MSDFFFIQLILPPYVIKQPLHFIISYNIELLRQILAIC